MVVAPAAGSGGPFSGSGGHISIWWATKNGGQCTYWLLGFPHPPLSVWWAISCDGALERCMAQAGFRDKPAGELKPFIY